MSLLAFDRVTKHGADGGGHSPVALLDGVSFEVELGESVGVWGLRRAGKSTLLRLAAGIQLPDAGAVRVDGRDTAGMSRGELASLLRTGIGVATVEAYPRRTEAVLDHVALPALSLRASVHGAQLAAREVLGRVGVTAAADMRMGELSPGERTRVAIARALVRGPRLLLVDEPGATPSPGERDEIYSLLRSLACDQALTLVVASEDVAAIRTARRAMTLSDGTVRTSDRRGTVVSFPGSRADRAV